MVLLLWSDTVSHTGGCAKTSERIDVLYRVETPETKQQATRHPNTYRTHYTDKNTKRPTSQKLSRKISPQSSSQPSSCSDWTTATQSSQAFRFQWRPAPFRAAALLPIALCCISNAKESITICSSVHTTSLPSDFPARGHDQHADCDTSSVIQ